MEIICIEGSAPGRLVATVAHEGRVRQLPMLVARHPAGGWHAAKPPGDFGPRCHAVETCVLLEASETFTAADNEPALQAA